MFLNKSFDCSPMCIVLAAAIYHLWSALEMTSWWESTKLDSFHFRILRSTLFFEIFSERAFLFWWSSLLTMYLWSNYAKISPVQCPCPSWINFIKTRMLNQKLSPPIVKQRQREQAIYWAIKRSIYLVMTDFI